MRPPRYHILAEEAVPAPTAGLDTASADTYVAPNRARTLTNFLPGRAGKLPLRGPLAWSADIGASITPGNGTSGAGWTFDDKVLVVDGSGNAVVVDFATPSAPIISAAIALPAGLSGIGGLSDGSYAKLGNYVFGPTLNKGITRWDGTSVTGGFVEMTLGPVAVLSVAVWLDRIWALGGQVPGGGGGTNHRNRIYWTDPAWDGTNTLAAWQDDVTGLTNQIILDNEQDLPLGLATFGRSLLVFRQQSITAITGSSPANLSVRTVAHIGCTAVASIVVHDTGVYFMSDLGYMVYDGATVSPVSAQLDVGVFAQMRDLTVRSLTTASLVDSKHLLLSGPNFNGLLHLPSRSWSLLTLPGISNANPALVGMTTNHPFAITNLAGNVRVSLLDHITAPEFARATSVAFSDFGTTPYGGTVESRIIELGSPEAKANLHRILLDSKPLGTTGFTATIEALDGTVLKTVAIPSSSNNWVQRTVADLDGVECEFVRLKWSLTSATGPAEIQDARIEFQHEQQRTG